MWDYNLMRPEKGQECKWNSRSCGFFFFFLVCLLCYSCKELSHRSQMQAAVSPSGKETKVQSSFWSTCSGLVVFKTTLDGVAASSRTRGCQDGLRSSHLEISPATGGPVFLICLSPMVMSAELSKSNIHAQADLLVLFPYKNRPYITLAAASSRYVDALCVSCSLRQGLGKEQSTYLSGCNLFFWGFFCFVFYSQKSNSSVFSVLFSTDVTITMSFSIWPNLLNIKYLQQENSTSFFLFWKNNWKK